MTTGVGLTGHAVEVWRDGDAWDEFVCSAPDSTVAHRWAWTHVVAQAYGHHAYPLAAVSPAGIEAVLPLVLVRSVAFGRQLVSMPYLDTGGLCGGDADTRHALVTRAVAIGHSFGAALELRHLRDFPIGLVPSLHKVTMTVPVSTDPLALWQRVRPNRRSQVRKARRAGLECVVVGSDGLDHFYRIMAENMRDLGSPMHRRRFFAAILDEFGDDARVLLVRNGDGEALAAGLVLRHRDRLLLPFSSCPHRFRATGANQLLYWAVLEFAVECGCEVVDFGRSSPGSGTHEAKREWGAEEVQLYWHRDRNSGTADIGDSRLALAASRVWKRLPVPAATALGAAIRGGLPQ